MNSQRIQHTRRPDLKLDKPAGRRGIVPPDRLKNLLNCGRFLPRRISSSCYGRPLFSLKPAADRT
mgnify:CR=1 FL=1